MIARSLLVSLFLAAPLSAADPPSAAWPGRAEFEKAMRARFGLSQKIDRAAGRAAHVKAAELGHPISQLTVASFLREGKELPADPARAAKLAEQALPKVLAAADQGDADCQACLGWVYDEGMGVPKDRPTAMLWCRKAAEQGHAVAQYILGVHYLASEGVDNASRAREWFQKSADQGCVMAQANVGTMHAKGLGGPQDYKQALDWFRKAADQGATRLSTTSVFVTTRVTASRRTKCGRRNGSPRPRSKITLRLRTRSPTST